MLSPIWSCLIFIPSMRCIKNMSISQRKYWVLKKERSWPKKTQLCSTSVPWILTHSLGNLTLRWLAFYTKASLYFFQSVLAETPQICICIYALFLFSHLKSNCLVPGRDHDRILPLPASVDLRLLNPQHWVPRSFSCASIWTYAPWTSSIPCESPYHTPLSVSFSTLTSTWFL